MPASSRVARVELRGLEPLTPSMPWRCATSCATAPPSPEGNNPSVVPGRAAPKSGRGATGSALDAPACPGRADVVLGEEPAGATVAEGGPVRVAEGPQRRPGGGGDAEQVQQGHPQRHPVGGHDEHSTVLTGIGVLRDRSGRPGTDLLSLIHISEPTRRTPISYAVFC